MKKLLTLIALVGACISAAQGLPADVEEKYNIVKNRHKVEKLKECIQNADALKFEKNFTQLPAKSLLELERLVNEAKKTTRFELSAMGDSDIGLSTIARGVLYNAIAGAGLGLAYKGLLPRGQGDLGFLKFIAGSGIFFCSIFRGIHALEQGLHYKQYLQDKLINLDAIAAHIAYEKSLVCPAPVNIPVAEEPVIQAKTVDAHSAHVGVRRNK